MQISHHTRHTCVIGIMIQQRHDHIHHSITADITSYTHTARHLLGCVQWNTLAITVLEIIHNEHKQYEKL